MILTTDKRHPGLSRSSADGRLREGGSSGQSLLIFHPAGSAALGNGPHPTSCLQGHGAHLSTQQAHNYSKTFAMLILYVLI